MNSPEQLQGGHERAVEASNAAAERSAELAKSRIEKGVEATPEKSNVERAHEARTDAHEALFSKEASKEKRSGGEPSSPAVIRKITKREKQRAYKHTMQRIQSEMSAPARTFSKIIHAPFVEKASDVAAGTVARPNALLSGAMVAFFVLTAFYVIGRTYGYPLSGFEMIGAYVLGWVVGLMIDYFRALTVGRVNS